MQKCRFLCVLSLVVFISCVRGPYLQAAAEAIVAKLASSAPVEVEGVDPSLHYLAPHIPKVKWTELGSLVVDREKNAPGAVDGSRWISLRSRPSRFARCRCCSDRGLRLFPRSIASARRPTS